MKNICFLCLKLVRKVRIN